MIEVLIKPEDTIGDIISNYPQLYEVFWENGFDYSSAAELVSALGKDTMLRTVLAVKGINVELFTDMINASVSNECQMQLEYDFYNPNLPVNLLVKTACPVSIFFKDKLAETIEAHKEATGETTNVFFVDGCHAPHEFERFWEIENIDKLPDIIMSMSFDEIYDQRFIDKYVNKGYFTSVLDIDQQYLELGCEDDSYTLNAGLVMVFLVDNKRLGDLPVPQTWEDLLDPIYVNQIIGFGDEYKQIFEYPLFYLYQEYGLESMQKLAHNVKGIYHAAKASQLAGTNSREGGAIYYMPLTFARLCESKDVSIIFPQDGAFIIPISFLVKKDKVDQLDYLLDFILHHYGQMCADINAAVFNSNIKSNLPTGTKLKWLGWDYIKSNDIPVIGERLRQEFHQAWDK